MRSEPACPTGYGLAQLDRWTQGARAWVEAGPKREMLLYFINGAKERAPAAAQAVLARLAADVQNPIAE